MPSPIQQRLKQVRQREGISQGSMARRLGQAYTLEDEGHDLTVAELLACQQALDVPLSELIDVPCPVESRAAVLRAYKSALSLREEAEHPSVQRLAERMIRDLLTAFPELDGSTRAWIGQRGVRSWPSVGARRNPDEPSMRDLKIIDTSTLSFTEPYAYAM